MPKVLLTGKLTHLSSMLCLRSEPDSCMISRWERVYRHAYIGTAFTSWVCKRDLEDFVKIPTQLRRRS